MDGAEFSRIFLPLADGMYRVSLYMLESSDDAADAVQDLYLKLWDRRRGLDSVKDPGAYCLTLMKNICIDRIRSRSRAAASEGGHELPDRDDPGVLMERKEDVSRVRRAVSALPESQRKVLWMRTVMGMSYEEIARETGMSPLSLRVLLSRARNTIKNVI